MASEPRTNILALKERGHGDDLPPSLHQFCTWLRDVRATIGELKTMKFEIKSRWNDNVIFEAHIECDVSASNGVKLGLAVRAAYASGADLSGADLRGAVLRGAVLRDAVLSDADLRGADLRGADLRGADLRDAVLSGAVLRGADLRGADLRGAVLRGAVLRDAVLRDAVLRGVPRITNIHQSIYAAASAENALDMSTWHATDACGTTHCRAGWVINLAGEGGRALEWALGTPAAAAIIYVASDPSLERVPDFHCGNEEALADMKRLADLEAAGNSKQ